MNHETKQQIKLCITHAFWSGVTAKGDKDDKEGICNDCVQSSIRLMEQQEEIYDAIRKMFGGGQ